MPSKNGSSSSGSGKKKSNNNKGTVEPSTEVISGTANASHCSRVTPVSVDTPRSSTTSASSSLVNCPESSNTAAMTNSNPGSSSTNSVPLTPATTGQVVGAQGTATAASVDNLR